MVCKLGTDRPVVTPLKYDSGRDLDVVEELVGGSKLKVW